MYIPYSFNYLAKKCSDYYIRARLINFVGFLKQIPPRNAILKLLHYRAQETAVSKSSARTSKLLKLRPYRTTVIHALQPRDPVSRVHFCSWFLQYVVEGDRSVIDILFWWNVVSPAGIHKYTKVRISLHSERYRLSVMLIRRQSSYALSSKLYTGRGEAQSRGTGQQSKNPPCITQQVRHTLYCYLTMLSVPRLHNDCDRTTDECGTVGGMITGSRNLRTRRKPAPAPFHPPQIPHVLTSHRARTAAVGSRRLTAWGVACPH
jgi:hypothetical protein